MTLSTGRVPQGAAEAMSLFPAGVPLIMCNGGILCRSGSGEILFERVMEPPDALAVMDWGRQYPGTVIVWTREGLFADRFNEATAIYTRSSGNTPRPLAPESAARAGVYKIMVLGLAETVEAARSSLLAAPFASVDGFTSSPQALEIVPRGVNKGSGLRECARLLELEMEETMAVGDGENDVPMLRAAGLGAAMDNAPDSVKAAAKLIAPSCEQDGAAWLMEKYLL